MLQHRASESDVASGAHEMHMSVDEAFAQGRGSALLGMSRAAAGQRRSGPQHVLQVGWTPPTHGKLHSH